MRPAGWSRRGRIGSTTATTTDAARTYQPRPCVLPSRRYHPSARFVLTHGSPSAWRRACIVCDPAGGSGQDSFTASAAHVDKSGNVVQDCLLEIRPPYSPTAAVCWRDGKTGKHVEPKRSGKGGKISDLKSYLPDADPGALVAHRWRTLSQRRRCSQSRREQTSCNLCPF